MSPRCELDLEGSEQISLLDTPAGWCRIIVSSLVPKRSAVQKISPRQTFTDIVNLRCDLDLEHSNPFFFTGHSDTIVYYQTKSSCKLTSSWEDTTEIVIFWLYTPSQWPWHWKHLNQFFNMTLWLMMLHNHTRFGDRMFCSSEDTVRRNNR